MSAYKAAADRAAAAGRGPAGLRRGDPGQAAAGRQSGTPGGPSWSGRGRRRRTCARSSRPPGRRTSCSPRPSPPGTDNPLVVDAEPAALAGAAGPRGAAPPPGGGRRSAPGAAPVRRRRATTRTRMRRCCCSTTRNWWPAGMPTSGSCWPRPGRPGRASRPVRAAGQPVDHRRAAAARPTRTRTPPNWPGRCRGRRRGRPGSAPGSTSGSSATSARRLATGSLGQQLLVDPDDLPDRADAGDRRTSRSCARCATPSRPGGSAERSRTRSRRRSRCWSTAGWSAAGSMRCTTLTDAGPTAASGSGWSTGRPAGRRRPTRCSWRSTGWPGRRRTRLPPEQVDAAFYYVRTDRLVRPDRPWPDRCRAWSDLLTEVRHEMPTSLIR